MRIKLTNGTLLFSFNLSILIARIFALLNFKYNQAVSLVYRRTLGTQRPCSWILDRLKSIVDEF